VYHSIHNYCVVDLSAFYLDILKDRLYTSAAGSKARRSAQTVLYEILSTLLRLMAPILSFTSEEAWWHLPGHSGESVHMERLPDEKAEYRNEGLNERWQKILALRADVSRALEAARQAKKIGHALDAQVSLRLPASYEEMLRGREDLMRSVLIVSRVVFPGEDLEDAIEGQEVEGLKIAVNPAPGDKCERCWVHSQRVGEFSEHRTLCERCYGVLAG